jgi:hypothetical protein
MGRPTYGGVALINDRQTTVRESYKVLAAQCREMAKRTARPGPLLIRAQAFEASAEELERTEPSDR